MVSLPEPFDRHICSGKKGAGCGFQGFRSADFGTVSRRFGRVHGASQCLRRNISSGFCGWASVGVKICAVAMCMCLVSVCLLPDATSGCVPLWFSRG